MNLYRRTAALLWPYWIKLIIATGSASLYALASGALIWLVGPLLMTLFQLESDLTGGADPGGLAGSVDAVVGHDLATSVESVREWLKAWINGLVLGATRQETLINLCICILGVTLAKNIFYYTQAFFMAFIQQSIMRNLRDQLFDKYQRLPLGYFHRRRTGQVISRVTNDVIVLNESIDIGFNRLVSDSIQALIFLAFLIILSAKLTLLAMVVLPAVFGFIWFVGKKMRKYSDRSQRRMADVVSVLEESISNMRIVKAFSMEKFEQTKFVAATRNYFLALLHMTRIRALASPINDLLATIAGVVILLYAGSSVILGDGDFDAGDFITFIMAMFAMIKPVKSLSQIHIKLQEGMAAAERIFGVIDTDERIIDYPTARTMEKFSGSIEYRDVHFSYKDGVEILKGVSLEVQHGEVLALVGPSGGGKSTLFDLLPRFYEPEAGLITVDGVSIKDIKLGSLRNLMGIVTQETFLFNDTIFNNIRYGLSDVSRERVESAAQMANAHQFISGFDDGYDTIVGNRGVMLSGGQRQRLAIARALLKDPQILIFDEATSALDTESEILVQEAIDNLMANRTTLVIAHRLTTIKNANRILVLDNGQIVESGSHEELLALGGLYERLYSMQFREDR